MAFTPVTTAEAIVLARYIGGRAALAQVRPVGLGTCLGLGGLVVVLVVLDVSRWFAVLVGVALVVSVVLSAVVSRTIRRVGLLDELEALEARAEEAQAWWPRLQDELRRVGIAPTPWTLLRIAAAQARRRSRGLSAQRAALAEVDWLAVVPHTEWHEARRLVAEAATGR